MRTVVVNPSKTSSLRAQFISLYEAFKGASPKESLLFDLNKLQWACPILILPISVYMQTTGSSFSLDEAHKLDSYLKAIDFPKGIDDVGTFFSMEAYYKTRTYVPISVLRRTSDKRDKLETLFVEMIYKILAPTEGARDAIYYPILELVTNIFEHSKNDEGYVFGQFYPKKQYVDICIVDPGRGLSKSYLEELGLQINDKEAITQAMEGKSTKPDKDRGYGVRTSKRGVCEALKGGFVYILGNAVLLIEDGKNFLFELPHFNLKGTIIAFRIPKPTGSVDIYPYLE